MEMNAYMILLLGMGAVTFIPRWLPMFFLSGKKLPQWFVDWLDFIPVAILSALLVPSILTTGTPREIVLLQPRLIVAVPTLLFALKTRSLAGTVIVGMGLYWLAERHMAGQP